MKKYIILAVALGLVGCGVTPFTASRSLTYSSGADGSKNLSYNSNTELEELKAILEEAPDAKGVWHIKKLEVNIGKSGTSPNSLAAAIEAQRMNNEMLKMLVEQIKSATGKGF